MEEYVMEMQERRGVEWYAHKMLQLRQEQVTAGAGEGGVNEMGFLFVRFLFLFLFFSDFYFFNFDFFINFLSGRLQKRRADMEGRGNE